MTEAIKEIENSNNIVEFPGKDSMFTVTPEDFEEKEVEKTTSLSEEDILKYKRQAENDGYAETAINEAVKLVTSEVATYNDFEKLIDKAMTRMKSDEEDAEQRKLRIKKSIQLEIDKLCKITDIASYADSVLSATYSTSAVTAMDLIKSASDEELQLDLYQEPVFSIILQINKPWVAERVSSILAGWESREYPKLFVENYLRSINVAEEDFDKNKADLIKFLPDVMQAEKSPDIYKQFKAVQLILQHKDPDGEDDLAEKIFSQTESMIEYDATFQNEMEDGTPSLAASACATEAAIDSIVDKSVDLAGAAGAFCGKVVSLKYKTAKNFDDMMMESMGEYGDAWLENKEASRVRRAELKQRKQELKHEAALHKAELKAEMKVKEAEAKAAVPPPVHYNVNDIPSGPVQVHPAYQQHFGRSQQNDYNQHDNRNYSRGRQSVVHNGNFAPQIPMPLIVAAINVIAGLLIWAIFGKSTAIFSAIGLVVAFCGFIKQKFNESGAILTIIGGYALTAVAVMLAIM